MCSSDLAPRSPWPEPLPASVDAAALATLTGPTDPAEDHPEPVAGATASIPFLLVDDPDNQRRIVGGWTPAAGTLAVAGCRGSGTTGALLAVLQSACRLRAALFYRCAG